MNLESKEFKPDGSGFYSQNLYKWLKKNPYYSKVYLSPWSSFLGYNPEKPVMMIGWLGEDGWFHGHQLRSVCVGSRMDKQSFAYGHPEMRIKEWRDITEQFISDYKRIGVCAIHGDNAHRFSEVNKKEKICLNCGVKYIKKSKRVTKHYWDKL